MNTYKNKKIYSIVLLYVVCTYHEFIKIYLNPHGTYSTTGIMFIELIYGNISII